MTSRVDPTKGAFDWRVRRAMDRLSKHAQVPHRSSYWDDSLPSATTTSASYADFPSSVSVLTFEKLFDSTKLTVGIMGSLYHTAANQSVDFGVQVNGGTDYTICRFYFNNASVHHSYGGARELTAAATLVAGTYTLQPRWKTSAATASVDSNDSLAWWVEEHL